MRLIQIDQALDSIISDRYEGSYEDAYKAIVKDIEQLRAVIKPELIRDVYPDINADTLPELFRKRDSIQMLIDVGYNLQPELERVKQRITVMAWTQHEGGAHGTPNNVSDTQTNQG